MKIRGLGMYLQKKIGAGVLVGCAALSGVAVLMGGTSFVGEAQAGVILQEDFEVNPSPNTSWVFDQYASPANYSFSPHTGVPGGGSFYGWAPNQSGTPPNTTSTTVNISGGSTISFDGWLASYTANDDYTRFEAEFFTLPNLGGATLGSVVLADGSLITAADGVTESVDAAGTLVPGDTAATLFNWKHYRTTVAIPGAGAQSVRIDYIGDATVNNGNDAYADNVRICIDGCGGFTFPAIIVDRTTGKVTMSNPMDLSLNIDFYEVISAEDSLDPIGWNSFDDQGLDSLGPGFGESWDEAGGSDSGLLREAFLLSSSLFDPGETQSLGLAYDSSVDVPNLVFHYRQVGQDSLKRGSVLYTASVLGDMDADGDVDTDDVPLFILALTDQTAYNALGHYIPAEVDIIGDINQDGTFDLGDVTLFNQLPGSGAAATQGVPEPTSTLLALVGGLFLVGFARRS